MALSQPKKPVGGAYGIFLSENRPKFAKATEGQRASAVSKMAGEAWKKLSEAEKKPYQAKFVEAKAAYEKALAAFLAGGGTVEKGIRAQRTEKRKAKEGKKAKKDPDAPKKPAGGAYGRFLADKRADIVKSLPAGHKITDVTKKAGEMWKGLTEAAKQPYEEKYKQMQEEYKSAMEEYKKTKGAEADADNDENEDDNEEEEEEEEPEKPVSKKSRKAGA
eukprot:TRINITY_DN7150_c0_g1_i4.p2 TRINITY_DN7150_c0_g1~~TRINITY_DN7150_c0_g1_i4.p2  ORF type:complete len:219 (-),score=99.28 TRINITY_DN7150_c0_g1_i4:312-968(-)